MIVCRRPWTIFDVDLMGLGALGAIVAAFWWLVLNPWQQTWNRYRDLSARRAMLEARLENQQRELERFEAGVAQIQAAVTAQAAQAPRAGAIAGLLRQLTNLAEQSHLELLSVTPHSTTHEGKYLVNEIEVAARGRSRDFIDYLDRLAQTMPGQTLVSCSITRSVGSTEPLCELVWALRLYLLPDRAVTRTGG